MYMCLRGYRQGFSRTRGPGVQKGAWNLAAFIVIPAIPASPPLYSDSPHPWLTMLGLSRSLHLLSTCLINAFGIGRALGTLGQHMVLARAGKRETQGTQKGTQLAPKCSDNSWRRWQVECSLEDQEKLGAERDFRTRGAKAEKMATGGNSKDKGTRSPCELQGGVRG